MKWWQRMMGKQPSLQQESEREAQDLERDILARELEVITAQHKIAGDRARQEHLIKWLQAKNKTSFADQLKGM